MTTGTSSGTGIRIIGVIAVIALAVVVLPRVFDRGGDDNDDRRDVHIFVDWAPGPEDSPDAVPYVTWTVNGEPREAYASRRPFFHPLRVTSGTVIEVYVEPHEDREMLDCQIVHNTTPLARELREDGDAAVAGCHIRWTGWFPTE